MTTKANDNCCSAPTSVENEVILTPQVDILETDGEAVVYMNLPGVSADGLTVRYEDSEIHIEGKRAEREGVGYLRQESPRGAFRRSFTVGETIDAEGIEAELKEGVLVLRLPKSAAAKSRRIEVRTG